MVRLHVCFKVVALCKSFATHFAGISVFVFIRSVQYFVNSELVFPSETFSAHSTFERSFSCVRHLMISQQFKPVVLDRAIGTLVFVQIKMLYHDMVLQLTTAAEFSFTSFTLVGFLSSVSQCMSFESR